MQAAEGFITVNLYGINYPMKFSNRVYNAFEENTGRDLNSLGSKLLNEWAVMKDLGFFDDDASPDIAATEAAARFSEVITKKDAAWLFYLCAKECNSKVDIGEMEEAVTFELFDEACFQAGTTTKLVNGNVCEGYHVRFFELFLFYMGMIKSEEESKKKASFTSFLKRLVSNR